MELDSGPYKLITDQKGDVLLALLQQMANRGPVHAKLWGNDVTYRGNVTFTMRTLPNGQRAIICVTNGAELSIPLTHKDIKGSCMVSYVWSGNKIDLKYQWPNRTGWRSITFASG